MHEKCSKFNAGGVNGVQEAGSSNLLTRTKQKELFRIETALFSCLFAGVVFKNVLIFDFPNVWKRAGSGGWWCRLVRLIASSIASGEKGEK